jgi:hypothetical protein
MSGNVIIVSVLYYGGTLVADGEMTVGGEKVEFHEF